MKVGYFGKVPSRGDFIGEGLPASFTTPWDAWLRGAMASARDRVGAPWQAVFLSSPVWRFLLAPAVCGPQAVAGVIASSADKRRAPVPAHPRLSDPRGR